MAGRVVDVHETEIIRYTLKKLQADSRATYSEMQLQLSKLKENAEAQELAASLGFEWKRLSFEYDAKSINAFANEKRQTTNDRGVLGALFVWLHLKHADALEHVQRNVFIPENEPFVEAARQHLGRKSPSSNFIKEMSGNYLFYRPFYRDPNNQVMLCSLEIGSNDALSYDCALHMRYQAPTGDEVSVIAKGKIVPINGRAFALLSVGKNGLFYLYFDKFNRDGDSEKVLLAEGTMIGSRDERQSTALPFVAARVDEKIEPTVIPRDDGLPSYVTERFSYGAVHWHPNPPAPKKAVSNG